MELAGQGLLAATELEAALVKTGIVGKAVSVADFSKTVNRELRGGAAEDYRVPDTAQGVAQTLLTYQNSHRPQDLWHSVTPDFRKGVIWLLLNSGDNRDMTAVVDAANDFMRANPPPAGLAPSWFGLTYINVIWQEKMVTGMLGSIAGSFLTILLLMIVLLRSTAWGLLAMVPLSATMLLIYGILGLAGRPYDMPVAVLSALTLGLSVDFAIHFIERARELQDALEVVPPAERGLGHYQYQRGAGNRGDHRATDPRRTVDNHKLRVVFLCHFLRVLPYQSNKFT